MIYWELQKLPLDDYILQSVTCQYWPRCYSLL